MTDSYKQVSQHYESCLEKHGSDTPKSMDWPTLDGMITRYKVMADIVSESGLCTLLDLGCGTGVFYSYLIAHQPQVKYTGIDLSAKFIEVCKNKYPATDFRVLDVLAAPEQLEMFDYIVMNGVFTMKIGLSHEQMVDFWQKMLITILPKTKKGLAFNVMSKSTVAWERDDLFYLTYDEIARFLTKLGLKTFDFRNDYGMYEFTTYAFK